VPARRVEGKSVQRSVCSRNGTSAMRRTALMSAVALLASPLVGVAPSHAAASPDIVEQLRQVPGMTVVSEGEAPAGHRFLTLSFTQRADHRNPSAGTFQQRVTLLHRGSDRPTVLHATGYWVPDFAFRSEPTRLIDGNQLSVEHRFFSPSRPEPADWRDLTIWQAATDHHRIVRALKAIYPLKWVSTGGSKGGMASVYHRRFYPADVDGTVAYSAPNDADERDDSAYDDFFANVGTPSCRTAIDDVQVQALKRRTALVARYETWAAANDRTFTILHSADRAFEFMVNGTSGAFWQRYGLSECPQVPPAGATDDTLMNWLDYAYGLDTNTDQSITGFVPYFYQAASELGTPKPVLPHLRRYQRYRDQDEAESYLPAALKPRFDADAMGDIDRWVRRSGRSLLFVYGQNDPWSAEPFRLGRGTTDAATFTAPGANHGASIASLVPGEAATATAMLQRWAAVSPPDPSAVAKSALDDYNPALDRRLALR
jgi:hypothetical protein